MIRSRALLISYAQLTAYGWFLYAFGSSVALLRDETGISRTVASLHGTALSLGGITIGLLGVRIIGGLGRGRALRLASLLIITGLLGYTSGGPAWVTITSMFVAGVGGSLMVTGTTAHLTDTAGIHAQQAVAEANSGAAAMGLLGPLAVGAGVALGFGWRPGVLAVTVMLAAIEVWRGSRLAEFATPAHAGESHAGADAPLSPQFWWALLTLCSLVGVEFVLTLWSADLIRERTGMTAASAAAALAAVISGMLAGRLTVARQANRVDPERLLIYSIVVAGAGFAVAWSATVPALALVGLFITGCGVGGHWPLGITRLVMASDGQSNRATSRASLGVGIASGAAPFVLATLADHVGVVAAFALTAPVLLVAALIMVLRVPIRMPLPSSS